MTRSNQCRGAIGGVGEVSGWILRLQDARRQQPVAPLCALRFLLFNPFLPGSSMPESPPLNAFGLVSISVIRGSAFLLLTLAF
jgi:hypothetical protein